MLNASAAKSSKASLPAGWRATRYPRRHVCLASSVAPAKSSIETLVMAVENGKNQSAMSANKRAVQSRLGSGNFLTQIIDLLRRYPDRRVAARTAACHMDADCPPSMADSRLPAPSGLD